MDKSQIGKIWGKGMLICDHCKKIKICEKIIYNEAGNTVFICEECKKRC